MRRWIWVAIVIVAIVVALVLIGANPGTLAYGSR